MRGEPSGIEMIIYGLGALFGLVLLLGWLFIPFILMGISKRLDKIIDNTMIVATVGQALQGSVIQTAGSAATAVNVLESMKPFLAKQRPAVEPPSRPAAAISFRCSYCDVPLKAPADDAGKSMDCPKCGKTGTVPAG